MDSGTPIKPCQCSAGPAKSQKKRQTTQSVKHCQRTKINRCQVVPDCHGGNINGCIELYLDCRLFFRVHLLLHLMHVTCFVKLYLLPIQKRNQTYQVIQQLCKSYRIIKMGFFYIAIMGHKSKLTMTCFVPVFII